jgi:hypothetical protein
MDVPRILEYPEASRLISRLLSYVAVDADTRPSVLAVTMTNKKAKRSRASKATTTSSDFSVSTSSPLQQRSKADVVHHKAMGSVISSTSAAAAAAAAAAIESFPPPTTNTVASVTNIDKPAQASIFIVHVSDPLIYPQPNRTGIIVYG